MVPKVVGSSPIFHPENAEARFLPRFFCCIKAFAYKQSSPLYNKSRALHFILVSWDFWRVGCEDNSIFISMVSSLRLAAFELILLQSPSTKKWDVLWQTSHNFFPRIRITRAILPHLFPPCGSAKRVNFLCTHSAASVEAARSSRKRSILRRM